MQFICFKLFGLHYLVYIDIGIWSQLSALYEHFYKSGLFWNYIICKTV